MVDAIICAIGEATAYLAGAIIGRTFRLEPKHAQRIGEIVVLVLLTGGLVTLTVLYS